MKEVYHQKFLSRLEIFWKNAFPFIFHLFFLLPLFPSYFIRTVPRRFFSASFSRHSFPPILNGQTGIAFSPAFPIAPLKHLATHCLPVFVFFDFLLILLPSNLKTRRFAVVGGIRRCLFTGFFWARQSLEPAGIIRAGPQRPQPDGGHWHVVVPRGRPPGVRQPARPGGEVCAVRRGQPAAGAQHVCGVVEERHAVPRPEGHTVKPSEEQGGQFLKRARVEIIDDNN